MNVILKFFCIIVFTGLTIAAPAAGELQFTDVFRADQSPFPSIRIPSMIVTKNGTLLAFAEGRAKKADQANNKIILKRSPDNGKTWSALQIIADGGSACLNNPCAVVDRKSGRVILMFQSYPPNLKEHDGGLQAGLDGTNIVRNFVIYSDDNGMVWSPMLDVTRTTKHGGNVVTMASGPGIGLQLQHGAHAGRIIIPFNEGGPGRWNVLAVYSDDGGANWQPGETVPGGCTTNAAGKIVSRVNEVQMVELAGGSIELNSRAAGPEKVRQTAVSRDGGATWSAIAGVPDLRDPQCMGSILRFTFSGADAKSVLLYSGPDSTKRQNGTIHISYDEGKTWPIKKVLFAGNFAYSILAELPGGTIGCLFETGHADKILFVRFPFSWILEPVPSQ